MSPSPPVPVPFHPVSSKLVSEVGCDSVSVAMTISDSVYGIPNTLQSHGSLLSTVNGCQAPPINTHLDTSASVPSLFPVSPGDHMIQTHNLALPINPHPNTGVYTPSFPAISTNNCSIQSLSGHPKDHMTHTYGHMTHTSDHMTSNSNVISGYISVANGRSSSMAASNFKTSSQSGQTSFTGFEAATPSIVHTSSQPNPQHIFPASHDLMTVSHDLIPVSHDPGTVSHDRSIGSCAVNQLQEESFLLKQLLSSASCNQTTAAMENGDDDSNTSRAATASLSLSSPASYFSSSSTLCLPSTSSYIS